MCCQRGQPSDRTQPSWHVHVRRAAWQSVRWCVAWLPCIKGHHRIHPAVIETPESVFILLESSKRIRVLHILPDLNSSVVPSQLNQNDATDSDLCIQKSLGNSTGEDYWFMRWNRPLRPALHRSSCNCSFRRSQRKSYRDLKQDSKSCGTKSSGNVAPAVVRKTFAPCKVDGGKEKGETQEQERIAGETQNPSENCEVESSLQTDGQSENTAKSLDAGGPNSSDAISTSIEQLARGSLNSAVDVGEIELNVDETAMHGYVNSNFLGSNGTLDFISPAETPNFCDNQNTEDEPKPISKDLNQDHNANDRSHQALEEMNARNKSSISVEEQEASITSNSGDSNTRKNHRKTCNVGLKSYLKKPLLLLIHGAGSSCEVWRGLILHLVQAGYECVAPDLLGHGLSSAPDVSSAYSFHSLLQDLLSVFDRFVTEGRSAVVLGHGYGCSLAAAIARYRPEQVVQLVLISGGGPTPLAPRIPPSVSPCMRACLEPLLMCGFKRDVVYSVCGKQMEPCAPETSAVPRHIVHHISQGHMWPEGDAAFHRRIMAPTLLVHGMHDQHITLVQQCEMERTIPRSFLEVIPDAGHWAMLETPVILSHMVLCFIDWWAPPNRAQ